MNTSTPAVQPLSNTAAAPERDALASFTELRAQLQSCIVGQQAQLDRFLMYVRVGYPEAGAERQYPGAGPAPGAQP